MSDQDNSNFGGAWGNPDYNPDEWPSGPEEFEQAEWMRKGIDKAERLRRFEALLEDVRLNGTSNLSDSAEAATNEKGRGDLMTGAGSRERARGASKSDSIRLECRNLSPYHLVQWKDLPEHLRPWRTPEEEYDNSPFDIGFDRLCHRWSGLYSPEYIRLLYNHNEYTPGVKTQLRILIEVVYLLVCAWLSDGNEKRSKVEAIKVMMEQRLRCNSEKTQ